VICFFDDREAMAMLLPPYFIEMPYFGSIL